jgi:hypothetical protein
MRKLERPDSITHILEVDFHEIKSNEEMQNIFKDVDKSDVLLWARIIDPVTFQPLLYFVIRNKNDSSLLMSLKYVGSYEMLITSGVDKELWNHFISKKIECIRYTQ